MSRQEAKAATYFEALTAARCAGKWSEVPELARKVKKHAPTRKDAVVIAQSEATVAVFHASSRSAGTNSLLELIPPLLSIVEGKPDSEEVFQAQTCLGWIHCTLREPGLAVSRLPQSVGWSMKQITGGVKRSASRWTLVCSVKAAYLKGRGWKRSDILTAGVSEQATSKHQEAFDTFRSGLPFVAEQHVRYHSEPELRMWTERLLVRLCVMCSIMLTEGIPGSSLLKTSFEAFRLWEQFWESKPGQTIPPLTGPSSEKDVTRRKIWEEYYAFLSKVLQEGLPFTRHAELDVGIAPSATMNVKAEQNAELQRVQTVYESILLKESSFPQAQHTTPEVHRWVQLLCSNWAILVGPGWEEEDTGHGGKEALGRKVLDALYRASAKTYHSTAVMRSLFTLHYALAEFPMAKKSLDTYLELVDRTKLRIEASGEPEAELDKDSLILETAHDGIRMLCQYGHRAEAERAHEIGALLGKWIKSWPLFKFSESNEESRSARQVLSVAHRAIGLSLANWARYSFVANSRSEVRLDAIKNLRLALEALPDEMPNLDALFALALMLAEIRDVPNAMIVLKRALLVGTNDLSNPTISSDPARRFQYEMKLIPFYHLLSLLLSSSQDYITAEQTCEAAFAQFQEQYVAVSEHALPSMRLLASGALKSIASKMPFQQREMLLQIKATSIALIEAVDGPEVAVNSTGELVAMFHVLFAEIEPEMKAKQIALDPGPPPKTANGTIKSIGGSIASRSWSLRRARVKPTDVIEMSETSSINSNHTTNEPSAPTIQVTDEDAGTGDESSKRSIMSRTPSQKLRKHPPSLRKQAAGIPKNKSAPGTPASPSDSGSFVQHAASVIKRTRSFHKAETASSAQTPPPKVSLELPSPLPEIGASMQSPTPSQVGLAVPPEVAPPPVESNGIASKGKDVGLAITNAVDVPNYVPPSGPLEPAFSLQQRVRRANVLLVRVWLLIARLYRKVGIWDEASTSLDEATKLTQRYEKAVEKETQGQFAYDEPEWGFGKSVGELWADVWAERGYLEQAESSLDKALECFEHALTYHVDHPAAIIGLSNILLDTSASIVSPQLKSVLLPTYVDPNNVLSSSGPVDPLLVQGPPSRQASRRRPPQAVTQALGVPRTTTDGSITPAKQSLNDSQGTGSWIGGEVKSMSRLMLVGSQTSNNPLQKNSRPDLKSSTNSKENILASAGGGGITSSSPATTSSPAKYARLAARDRAYVLLSSLTKLESGWDFSDAWFSLARAYEESGQIEKAKSALWWCVELEDAKPVRAWREVNSGGYVL